MKEKMKRFIMAMAKSVKYAERYQGSSPDYKRTMESTFNQNIDVTYQAMQALLSDMMDELQQPINLIKKKK
jgi:hypothetical protein